MKVIIICAEPFPEGMAATERIICYAKALHIGGIDCSVAIFGRTERKGSSRNTEAKGCYQGILYEYVGGSTIKPSHKIPRILYNIIDKLKLKQYLNSHLVSGDIVVGFVNADTDYMCSIIDIVHSKGARYVRELNEIPFFGASNLEAKQGLKKILRELFPKCDGFLVISKTLEEIAEANCNKHAKILRVPILVDYEAMSIEDRSCEADAPFVFHAGTLYEQKDGIIGMLEAFAKANKESGVFFRLVCTGHPSESPDEKEINKAISELGIADRVDFLGYCSNREIRDYLSRAFLAVINKRPNLQNLYCFSTKLGVYLAAGKPVIITDVGEAVNWLEDGRSAWIIPHDDVELMAEAMVSAIKNPQARIKIGEAGRIVCKNNFDFRAISPALCSYFENL